MSRDETNIFFCLQPITHAEIIATSFIGNKISLTSYFKVNLSIQDAVVLWIKLVHQKAFHIHSCTKKTVDRTHFFQIETSHRKTQ